MIHLPGGTNINYPRKLGSYFLNALDPFTKLVIKRILSVVSVLIYIFNLASFKKHLNFKLNFTNMNK